MHACMYGIDEPLISVRHQHGGKDILTGRVHTHTQTRTYTYTCCAQFPSRRLCLCNKSEDTHTHTHTHDARKHTDAKISLRRRSEGLLCTCTRWMRLVRTARVAGGGTPGPRLTVRDEGSVSVFVCVCVCVVCVCVCVCVCVKALMQSRTHRHRYTHYKTTILKFHAHQGVFLCEMARVCCFC